ncbi:hypothetical protein CON65_11600 [Bacillus pseudomycoides]|uniref:Uncharacterized protein n=1 Tax=Bacillus pseudomycoides TaxID=64104 RepID=A0AA91VC12_9BACI|nr:MULTISPECIES: hypothetical protein [Bacillus]PEB51761.1 hypothetical protein COO03_14820 [Bacillus sp. AFS098217]PED82410.1 hypothetical protein CON65_11600 [Bacillus pseudomycoides]PEU06428.1 hypothetical protein CN524_23290 [Bacillus sp. AFS019443]PEU18684.1 hypothetical protein CN525_10430 [Bacillus sp. AFS014408]PFW63947.1 hypothetical protein COL20_06585 [Bacillus sp. AFS075034]
MSELNFVDLPQIIEENKKIKLEVENLIRKYLQYYHPKGWTMIEGAKKYIATQHFLLKHQFKISLWVVLFVQQIQRNTFVM